MICKNCGKQIPDGANKCPSCEMLIDKTVGDAVEAVDRQKESYAPAASEKKQLYKAADIDPQRPSQRLEEEKPPRRKRRRAPIVTAAIWILAVLLLAAAVFAAVHFISNRNGSTVPDASDMGEETGEDTQQPDEGDAEPVDKSVPEPPEEKPVYEIVGAWRWESEKDGYRDTYWVFSEDGSLKIYMTGFAYEYVWPKDYTYDKESYVLSLTDQAMGIAWLDENNFACGAGKAFRIDEIEIPEEAVDVRELVIEDPEPPEPVDEYLLPDSATRYLTRQDLEKLDPEMLRFARNEIFARHGRLFSDESLQDYFNEQSWYNGYIKPKNFNSSVLNAYERYNAAFISNYEEELKR